MWDIKIGLSNVCVWPNFKVYTLNENLTQTTLSLVFCPNLNSGKLARCKGQVRLPARDTNSSDDDDDDDDDAVDALSPSNERRREVRR